jgi:hypothetical protein
VSQQGRNDDEEFTKKVRLMALAKMSKAEKEAGKVRQLKEILARAREVNDDERMQIAEKIGGWMRWRNDGYASESERTLTALYIEVGPGSSEVNSTQLLVRLKDFLHYATDYLQIINA